MKKIYYTQAEIAEKINEEAHIIRYWEKKIPEIQSKFLKNGRKVYTEKNIELFRFVKNLVRNQNLSIEEVRQNLAISLDETKKNTTITTVTPQEINHENSQNIVLSKEEFAELIQIMQLMLALIKSK